LNREQETIVMGNIDSQRDWGHAKDYIEGMWLILQQEKPDDFVLATGEMHSVREFIETAFALKGLQIQWKGSGVDEIGYDQNGIERIVIDKKYFRPTEVELLIGDAAKAKRIGWSPKIDFHTLVKKMVDHDCS